MREKEEEWMSGVSCYKNVCFVKFYSSFSSREDLFERKLGYNLCGRFMTQQAHGYDPFVSFYYIIFLIVLFSC